MNAAEDKDGQQAIGRRYPTFGTLAQERGICSSGTNHYSAEAASITGPEPEIQCVNGPSGGDGGASECRLMSPICIDTDRLMCGRSYDATALHSPRSIMLSQQTSGVTSSDARMRLVRYSVDSHSLAKRATSQSG